MSLVIGNTDVRSVQYNIVCEGGASFTDEFEVVDDRDPPVWETFVGLPSGENCVITLTAFNDAGNPICTGSTSVDIIEGQTVKADITLECPTTGEIGTGNVNIDGRFEEIPVDICPIIHILNAIPRVMTELPGESSLRVQATDPDGGEVDTVLSSTSGDIADPTSKNTDFTCSQGGLVEVTVTAAAGDPNCESRMTITLTCPDTGNACDGVDCDDNNECTDDGCADGVCSNVNAPDGTSCSIGECVDGQCQAVTNPCDGISCDDNNLCTLNLCDPTDGSCSNPSVADGTSCGVDLVCTGGLCGPATDVCDGVVCPVDPNGCIATSQCVDQGGVATCVDVAKPTNDSCSFGVHAGTCFGDCGPLSSNPAECVCGALSGCCEPTGECQRPVCTDQAPPNECGTPTNEPDGTACTGGTCQAGACVPEADVCEGVVCDTDPDDCIVSSCVDQGGVATCVDVAKPANDSCSFGVHAGSCFGDCGPLSSNPAECVCGALSGCCEPTGECQRPVCTDQAPPNECGTPTNEPDGTACTGGTCQAGVCEAGGLCEGVVCDDGDDCTIDNCDPATGSCFTEDAADGTPCAVVGGIGQCQSLLGTVSPPLCIPTQQCPGEGTCDDLNDCTTDVCNPDFTCTNTPKPPGTSCNLGPLNPGTCDANAVCQPDGVPPL